MKVFISTILVSFCLSLGLGLYAQQAHSEEASPTKPITEDKAGRKMETSPKAEKAPFDLQYIDTMTLHHKAAISMAELAATHSDNGELKLLSQTIINEQQKDIADMAVIRSRVYAGRPKAENMEMKGMKTSMEDMDMEKLKEQKGADFDKLYIQMMTTHHQGGVTMAKAALEELSDKKLIEMSNNIIATQTAEIAKLKTFAAAMDTKEDSKNVVIPAPK